MRYELGIGTNEFVQSVADVLRDPSDSPRKSGVVGGYIDDLY